MEHGQSSHDAGASGFTLVELLVVVVILGILAAIVVFAMGGTTERGQDSADKVDLRAVEIAQEHAFARSLRMTGSPVYASETQLVDYSLLRGLSSKHDVCLRSDAKDYFVDAAGTDCSTPPPGRTGTFSLAP